MTNKLLSQNSLNCIIVHTHVKHISGSSYPNPMIDFVANLAVVMHGRRKNLNDKTAILSW